jgi:hypothetical protein
VLTRGHAVSFLSCCSTCDYSLCLSTVFLSVVIKVIKQKRCLLTFDLLRKKLLHLLLLTHLNLKLRLLRHWVRCRKRRRSGEACVSVVVGAVFISVLAVCALACASLRYFTGVLMVRAVVVMVVVQVSPLLFLAALNTGLQVKAI